MRTWPLSVLLVASSLAFGAPPATAQRVGTLAEWKARVLDPASLDLQPFPGATFNQKFTIDQIRLDETAAKMAVYLIPADRMAAAADFYARQLGVSVDTSGVGTAAELRLVRAAPGDRRRAGLTVRVENAHWATGQGQVWLRRDSPAQP
jgi:hypothetical protein